VIVLQYFISVSLDFTKGEKHAEEYCAGPVGYDMKRVEQEGEPGGFPCVGDAAGPPLRRRWTLRVARGGEPRAVRGGRPLGVGPALTLLPSAL
jgi:hypothetical protein